MIISYSELTGEHRDVLREIGNIGAGNAATSLRMLLDEDVRITIPELLVTEYDEAIRLIGGPEEMIVAVLIEFSGDASGMVLFLLSINDARHVTDILVGQYESEQHGFLSDLEMSAIKEIGNIISSAYLGAIADLTDMHINVSIPHIAVDMTGAIFATIISRYGASDSKLMFIDEGFCTVDSTLKSNVIMFTGMDTLKDIMQRLGVNL